MREVTFTISDKNTYEGNPEATPISHPVTVVKKDGRIFTQIIYSCAITAMARMASFVKAFAATIFTVFLWLFSERSQELWSQALTGKESVSVLAEKIKSPRIRGLSGNKDSLLGISKNLGQSSFTLNLEPPKGPESLISEKSFSPRKKNNSLDFQDPVTPRSPRNILVPIFLEPLTGDEYLHLQFKSHAEIKNILHELLKEKSEKTAISLCNKAHMHMILTQGQENHADGHENLARKTYEIALKKEPEVVFEYLRKLLSTLKIVTHKTQAETDFISMVSSIRGIIKSSCSSEMNEGEKIEYPLDLLEVI